MRMQISKTLFFIFTLFMATFIPGCFAKQNVCQVVLTRDFDTCNNRAAELKDFADDELNRVYSLSYTNANEACNYQSPQLCRHVFKAGRMRGQSFGAKTLVRISDMLSRCCGKCAKYYRQDIFVKLPDLNVSVVEEFDIVYPVLGRFSEKEMYGFHFIPVFKVPNSFYFTMGRSKQEMASTMIMSCLRLWPIFVSCLLLSFIAGFIAWLLEAPFGNEDFPKNFFLGMYESFWWSFITMTTVGYGDKITKKLPGRIFAVIWILVGITVCSIFVASLSSEIMMFSTPATPKLSGQKVGALANHLHDAIMVSQHGGIIHSIAYNKTIDGVFQLVKMLNQKEIDGYLISRSTYFYFARVLREKSELKEMAAYVNNLNLVRTETSFKDDEIVTGMLVKYNEHYEYFRRYFESNWLQIQACYSYSSNYKDKKFDAELLVGLDGLFAPFLNWILVIMGAILLFGLSYEVVRYWLKKNKATAVAVDEEINGT